MDEGGKRYVRVNITDILSQCHLGPTYLSVDFERPLGREELSGKTSTGIIIGWTDSRTCPLIMVDELDDHAERVGIVNLRQLPEMSSNN